MTNAALIARLEKAKEGTRALSDEVLRASGWTTQPGWNDGTNWISPDGSEHGDSADSRPDPTTSLDDAVALVPEGLYWSIGWHTSTGNLLAKSVLWPPGPWPGPNEGWRGEHKEPAMSFSIAILKAMETE